MRKLHSFGIAVLCLAVLLLAAAPAKAGPTLVFDTKTGEVLHAYKPFDRWHPASLTKLMTVYVTFDAVAHGMISMQSLVTMTPEALAQPPSKMGYPVGTQITVEDAIRILLVKSANDVSVALAQTVAGSEERFVAGMNTAAMRLGMTDTNFVNPHGLPDDRQISSARDLALLTMALIQRFPHYQGFFSMPSVKIGDRVLKNHNKLIGQFRGADGMKTGFICASGFNVVSTATRSGRRLAVVVLGATNPRKREEVAATLLEAGFAQGRGFSLFGGGRTTIADLRRTSNLIQPVDMTQYACRKRPMPPEIASFGFSEQPDAASAQDAALALAPGDLLRKPQGLAEPVSTLSAQQPPVRPFEQVAPATIQPGAPQLSGAAAMPEPRPNPLRGRTFK